MADQPTIVQAETYKQVNAQLEAARAFLALVTGALVQIDAPNIDPLPEPDYAAATANNYTLFTGLAPFAVGGVIGVPLPTPPVLSFSDVETVTVPDFAQTPPSINVPTASAIVIPSTPAQPSVTDVALPTAPTINLPVAPVFSSINIPQTPSINIPSFTSTLPAEDFLTPSNTFSFAEQPYVSALLDAEKAKLMADLVNGGYGIEPLDETNLWNRARDRETGTTLMEIDEAFRFAGARGFPLPPGDIAVVVERASQKQQEKLSSISREIAIKRADMFVENRKFTITQVKELESILMNYWNSVQERGLNAAKATLDAAIRIYETQLQRFNARLEGYKADAQVFEARLRAVATQTEIYRTQIQAAQVTADVQRIQVEVYNAQLRGVDLTVQIFRTQMEAANIAAQIQRLKIEAFRALIDAYTAQVQAEVAKQQAYEARIRGELAKAQIYEAQARGYAATVEGLKVRADVLIAKARAEWEQARVKVEEYQGQIQAADITLKGQTAVVNANLGLFQTRGQIYAEQARVLVAQSTLNETAINNSRQIQVEQARVQIATAQTRLSRAIETLKIQAAGLGIEGDFYKNLLAALASEISAIATATS